MFQRTSDSAGKGYLRTKAAALGVATALLLPLFALSPGAASARPQRLHTRLDFVTFGVIYPSGKYDWVFSGDLILSALPCIGHREVHFYRKDFDGGPDTEIGSKTANFLGQSIFLRHQPDLATVQGTYYAKVDPKRKKTRHGRILCRGDRSGTITVKNPQLQPVESKRAGALAQVGALGP